MAEFRQFTFTNTGTEIDFVQALFDLITEIDDGIIIEDSNGEPITDAADLYVDTTVKAIFYLNLGNNQKIKFERWTVIRDGTQSFLVNNQQCLYSTGNMAYDYQGIRQFFIGYYKSENVTALWFGSYNATTLQYAPRSGMVIKTANDRFAAVVTNNNPIVGSFVGSNSTITFVNIMNYSAGVGNIDYIEKSVFVSGGARALFIPDIFSCSTVAQWSTIALPNGKLYFAIHTNAMIDITPPESENEETTDAQNAAVESVS
jgi:hypothetical protein